MAFADIDVPDDPDIITVEALREEIGRPANNVGDALSYTPDSVLKQMRDRLIKERLQSLEEQILQTRPVGELAYLTDRVEIPVQRDGKVAQGTIPDEWMPFSFDWAVVADERVERFEDLRWRAQTNPYNPKGYEIVGRKVEVLPANANAIDIKLVRRKDAREALFRNQLPQINNAIVERGIQVVKARMETAGQMEQETLNDAPST